MLRIAAICLLVLHTLPAAAWSMPVSPHGPAAATCGEGDCCCRPTTCCEPVVSCGCGETVPVEPMPAPAGSADGAAAAHPSSGPVLVTLDAAARSARGDVGASPPPPPLSRRLAALCVWQT
ncbi:MAG: hypothetical protein ACYTG1_03460 [Planctomycetota bacterium]|jgi:hypothetical protein